MRTIVLLGVLYLMAPFVNGAEVAWLNELIVELGSPSGPGEAIEFKGAKLEFVGHPGASDVEVTEVNLHLQFYLASTTVGEQQTVTLTQSEDADWKGNFVKVVDVSHRFADAFPVAGAAARGGAKVTVGTETVYYCWGGNTSSVIAIEPPLGRCTAVVTTSYTDSTTAATYVSALLDSVTDEGYANVAPDGSSAKYTWDYADGSDATPNKPNACRTCGRHTTPRIQTITEFTFNATTADKGREQGQILKASGGNKGGIKGRIKGGRIGGGSRTARNTSGAAASQNLVPIGIPVAALMGLLATTA